MANSCFDRTRKIAEEEDAGFDIDTMLHGKKIRGMLKMLEPQSLDNLVAGLCSTELFDSEL